MKYFLWIFLFGFITTLSGQTKDYYFVTFTDKGILPTDNLNDHPQYLDAALNAISEKSKERRAKHRGTDNIVDYDDVPVNKDYLCKLQCEGATIRYTLKWFNAALVATDSVRADQFKLLPFVKGIEKYGTVSDDSELAQMASEHKKGNEYDSAGFYGNSLLQLEMSTIPEVHDLGYKGSGILIGMLDSGFDWQHHEAFQNTNILDVFDFVFKDSVVSNEQNDTDGQDAHGTYCFSITGGYKPGQLIGVAHESTFLLAKTEDGRSETRVEEVNYAAALEWMDSIGVDITSSSLGYTKYDDQEYTYERLDGKTALVSQAVDKAFERGITTLTAAGNEGNKEWQYLSAPADAFNVISVAAVSTINDPAYFTSKGPTFDNRLKPDIATLGISVFGIATNTQKGYVFKNGTSSATPIAAGVAALLLEAHPHLLNHQIKDILIKSGDLFFFPDTTLGSGLISALKALTFPNIDATNNEYLLHKLIPDAHNDNPEVFIHIINQGDYVDSLKMNALNDRIFTVDLTTLLDNHTYDFYFSYNNINGAYETEKPEIGYYRLTIGEDVVGYTELMAFNLSGIIPLKQIPISKGVIWLDENYADSDFLKLLIKTNEYSNTFKLRLPTVYRPLLRKKSTECVVTTNNKNVLFIKRGNKIIFTIK